MAKIKVSELFYSIQGEGRYQGVPSVFLRTFGCNFKCAGFGLPKGQLTKEVDGVAEQVAENPDLYTTYNHLPLVSTGCDSYASWDSRFKHLSPVLRTDTIANTIMSLLPSKKWQDEHLVITGGEPLLGWQRGYPDLLNHPDMQDLRELTFETNGTQSLSPEFKDYLVMWTNSNSRNGWGDVTFSVSPKLSGSGENQDDAIKPENIMEYQDVGYTYLKFVVANEEDVLEAIDAINDYRLAGFNGPSYLMPVGGVESVYSSNNKNVALLAIKYGLRYSDRLQVPLFKNAWGT